MLVSPAPLFNNFLKFKKLRTGVVVNSTTVTAMTPAGAVGTVDVVITTPFGAATLTNGYTYAPEPTLTAVNPNSGPTVGGTGVTLTGTGLTGATSVTFGGVAATGVTVVNSTTVTALTPAGAVGMVDVVITTPGGAATLTNGYTYVATVIGEAANGGKVACMDGGAQDLIASTDDNSDAIVWAGVNTVTNATSTTNGATNTETIVTSLGPGIYAAQLCNDFEIDSQGNTPCQAGNFCYNDWFLPAQTQSDCLCTNKGAIGGFSAGLYWTSTEVSASLAIGQDFNSCGQGNGGKGSAWEVRCVRNLIGTSINPNSGAASGGTGFVITGSSLAGATSVTFGGIAATSFNLVNPTTVTGVTPAHAAGVVDVVIDTPGGAVTLTNGYTYVATAVGQSAFGGKIACLNGGLNDLIAATSDNSAGIIWGTDVAVGASSDTDGAGNTAAIVAEMTTNQGLPINTYAAGLCSSFEVDSQGNTPCQAGNTCYNDWFLPAGNNLLASGQLNCLAANRLTIGGFDLGVSSSYWSSTRLDPAFGAFLQRFSDGASFSVSRGNPLRVRCVRAFNP